VALPTLPRILVVDDNEDLCHSLQRILQRQGYEVECAYNGAEALQIQSKRPAHIIITDLVMPDRDGIETIAELKRDFPQVRVIAMSGGAARMSGDKYLYTAGVVGAEVLLEKPLDHEQLLAAVRRMAPSPPSS
jgi:CheY-like chemotaxis protein